METATALWRLEDLVAEIVRRVESEHRPASEIVDEMAPIRLRPDEQARMIREGVIRIANDRTGLRGFRSGHTQSVRPGPRPVPEESAGLDEYANKVLARMIYEAADGSMRSVLDFTREDAELAYQRRVVAIRDQADREDPFWSALIAETDRAPLRKRSKKARARLAKLAVTARLTTEGV